MISQETKDQIEKEARDYADSSSSDIDDQMLTYYACVVTATKYAEKLEEKDKAYNELGIKFDKEVERWQERDTDELEKRLALQTELAQLKEIAEKMINYLKDIERCGECHSCSENAGWAITAYTEWCKQNLK